MRGAVAICLAGVLACAGDEPAVAPPSPRPIAAGPTTLPPPAPPELPAVRLRSPGGEPRRELRYRPVVGRTHELALGIGMRVAMAFDGKRVFDQDSPTSGKLVLRVTGVERGNIKIDLHVREMTEPTFDPELPKLKSLAGLRGWFEITDRGLVVAASPSLESAATREMLFLSDYTLPLPAEPVGVGAEWEVDSVVLRNNMTLRLVQTHKLIAFEGDAIKTVVTETHHAAAQPVAMPIGNPLVVFELASMTGTGSGEITFTLDRPLPARIRNVFELDTKMKMTAPSTEQHVAMTIRGDIRATLD